MKGAQDLRVRSLTAEDQEAAVAVLVDAFGAYPTLRWVLAPSPMPHDAALTALIGFFVTARLLRGEPVTGPRLQLNLLGAARAAQGRGVGGALLERVLAAPSAQGRTVVTATEDAANLAFYERHGFSMVGSTEFGDDLTVWALGRAAGPSDGLA